MNEQMLQLPLSYLSDYVHNGEKFLHKAFHRKSRPVFCHKLRHCPPASLHKLLPLQSNDITS